MIHQVNAAWEAINNAALEDEATPDTDEQGSSCEESSSEYGLSSDGDSEWSFEHDIQDYDKHYDYGDLDEEGGSYAVQLEDGREVSLEEHTRTCTCDTPVGEIVYCLSLTL